MTTSIEYTDEFGKWWSNLNSSEQEDITAIVILLEEKGTNLGFP